MGKIKKNPSYLIKQENAIIGKANKKYFFFSKPCIKRYKPNKEKNAKGISVKIVLVADIKRLWKRSKIVATAATKGFINFPILYVNNKVRIENRAIKISPARFIFWKIKKNGINNKGNPGGYWL